MSTSELFGLVHMDSKDAICYLEEILNKPYEPIDIYIKEHETGESVSTSKQIKYRLGQLYENINENEKAYEYYLDCANNGLTEAQKKISALNKCFLESNEKSQLLKIKENLFSNNCYSHAQYKLYCMEKDDDIKMTYLMNSYKYGNILAMRELDLINSKYLFEGLAFYESGNYKLALYNLEKIKGHLHYDNAQYVIGEIITKKDSIKALDHYLNSAKTGYERAQSKIDYHNKSTLILADKLYESEQYNDCLNKLKEIKNYNDKNSIIVNATILEGNVYSKLGNNKKAWQKFTEAANNHCVFCEAKILKNNAYNYRQGYLAYVDSKYNDALAFLFMIYSITIDEYTYMSACYLSGMIYYNLNCFDRSYYYLNIVDKLSIGKLKQGETLKIYDSEKKLLDTTINISKFLNDVYSLNELRDKKFTSVMAHELYIKKLLACSKHHLAYVEVKNIISHYENTHNNQKLKQYYYLAALMCQINAIFSKSDDNITLSNYYLGKLLVIDAYNGLVYFHHGINIEYFKYKLTNDEKDYKKMNTYYDLAVDRFTARDYIVNLDKSKYADMYNLNVIPVLSPEKDIDYSPIDIHSARMMFAKIHKMINDEYNFNHDEAMELVYKYFGVL